MIELHPIKRSDSRLITDMANHYVQGHGFVGRNLCYAICCGERYHGSIVGGSATLHLPGRKEFFGPVDLRRIVNNIFFHVERPTAGYPCRNFVSEVLKIFRAQIQWDWKYAYGQDVLGYETLVELPRTGECYRRDGWTEVGVTKGFGCKRVAGRGTDNWSGKRVWQTDELRPKRVFMRLAECSQSDHHCCGWLPLETIGVDKAKRQADK